MEKYVVIHLMIIVMDKLMMDVRYHNLNLLQPQHQLLLQPLDQDHQMVAYLFVQHYVDRAMDVVELVQMMISIFQENVEILLAYQIVLEKHAVKVMDVEVFVLTLIKMHVVFVVMHHVVFQRFVKIK